MNNGEKLQSMAVILISDEENNFDILHKHLKRCFHWMLTPETLLFQRIENKHVLIQFAQPFRNLLQCI